MIQFVKISVYMIFYTNIISTFKQLMIRREVWGWGQSISSAVHDCQTVGYEQIHLLALKIFTLLMLEYNIRS